MISEELPLDRRRCSRSAAAVARRSDRRHQGLHPRQRRLLGDDRPRASTARRCSASSTSRRSIARSSRPPMAARTCALGDQRQRARGLDGRDRGRGAARRVAVASQPRHRSREDRARHRRRAERRLGRREAVPDRARRARPLREPGGQDQGVGYLRTRGDPRARGRPAHRPVRRRRSTTATSSRTAAAWSRRTGASTTRWSASSGPCSRTWRASPVIPWTSCWGPLARSRRCLRPSLVVSPALAQAQPTPAAEAAGRRSGEAGDREEPGGRARAAIELYLKAYAIVPLPTLLSNVGTEYQQIDKPVEALKYFCMYLEKDPTGPLAHLRDARRPRRSRSSSAAPSVEDEDVCKPVADRRRRMPAVPDRPGVTGTTAAHDRPRPGPGPPIPARASKLDAAWSPAPSGSARSASASSSAPGAGDQRRHLEPADERAVARRHQGVRGTRASGPRRSRSAS